MAEGTYAITSIATLGRSVSPQSSALSLTIDRTVPTISCQWLENEIGPNITVHLDCSPSEAISGFASSDLIVPSSLNDGELEFAQAQVVQTGYRVAIATNGYNITDLVLFLREDAFADLAGNDFFAANYSNYLGYRYTATPYLHLDLEGPRIETTNLEAFTTPMPYGKLTFTFDEVVRHAQLDDFEIAYYSSSQFGISRFGSIAMSSIATDGVLHTNDNKTFWIFISQMNYFDYIAYANTNTLAAVAYSSTDIADEFGNLVDTGIEGQLGDWAY
jgi:hypothetical protein